MKKIIIALLLLMQFGCATILCTAMCDEGDSACYNDCRVVMDELELDDY